MRTIETNIYQFSELSETAKAKAIENLYDINVDYNWWQFVYEDAKNIGLKITAFDLDRNRNADGEFLLNPVNVAKAILNEHGETCETYKTAKTFLGDCEAIQKKAEAIGTDGDEDYWHEDEISELEDEFLKNLLEDYSIILQKEYEYLTSEEAIIQTIEANEYEFTEDGKRV